jgi:Holliday junction resolvase-like predicted endonuclease
MDNKILISSTGEAKVVYELTSKGYHIFNQVTGKAPFDLIAYKDDKLIRVSVKTVSVKNKWGSYEAQLRRIRSNKTSNTIHLFDKNECDILAIYIFPEDLVFYINPKDLSSLAIFTITSKLMEERKAGVLMGPENLEVI